MPRRRLSLNREVLAALQPTELESVAGAAPISLPHVICAVTQTGSIEYSQCPTCGIACTANCPTRDCQ